MENVKQLSDKIEVLRLRMYQLYTEKPNSTELLEASQQLDQSLNELWWMQNKAKPRNN